MSDIEKGKHLLALREKIVANFTSEDWQSIGLLTGSSETIIEHPRLLRSLYWGDEDYSGNVLEMLQMISNQNEKSLSIIEDYLDEKYPGKQQYISAKPSERKITFAPNVFQIPEDHSVERDLVAVMMPFRSEFDPVYQGIQVACKKAGLRCLRVDDIWEEPIIIQEIFNLIFRSYIVVVDFTGKNPNVLYETGIAHTLGKHVIPISQSIEDVPFDMKHHRVLKYLINKEGIQELIKRLSEKLKQVSA
jgi:hypothetical protein